MPQIYEPENCKTMTEVRAGVDDVDRRIVALMARRFAFMDAAARIKQDRDAVRDEQRKAEVLSKVEAAAAELGLDPQLMRWLYQNLIDNSIDYELDKFDLLRSA